MAEEGQQFEPPDGNTPDRIAAEFRIATDRPG